MLCLVTGATGFVGGYVTKALLKQGHQVRAFVRPGADTAELENAGVAIATGHLTDPADVDAAVKGCDQVFHLAAVFRTAGHPDQYYFDVNVGGTKTVLDAARRFDCERLVHCSTVGVHGDIHNPPADENYPFQPGDIYQRSKLEGELEVQKAIGAGQPAVIVRPTPVYGEGDLRLLKLYKAIARSQFIMFGSGEPRFHMAHVEDLADGILLSGSRPEAVGQIFLLGGPDAPTLNELATLIADATGAPPGWPTLPVEPIYFLSWLCEKICIPFAIDPPLYRRRVAFFINHREFDCSKAARLIGYSPKIHAPEGVRRTANWYAEKGLL
jgi:nucleoside-diphosphate-sugar epimerase